MPLLTCKKCGRPFDPADRWYRWKFEKGHVPLCPDCWDLTYGIGGSGNRLGSWRGKGSYGSRPAAGMMFADRDDQ